MRVVPDVTDVLVSPSSVVTEFCDVSPCCSDWVLFVLTKNVHIVVQIRRKR